MYLFYAVVLRRLTFYNHHRWYLLGYSVLCFIIPLINIKLFTSNSQSGGTVFVRMIPNVVYVNTAETSAIHGFDAVQIIVLIVFIGSIVMLLRLLFQLLSYKKLASNAKIISGNDAVKLYQVDEEIVPFSFGNSIFINQDLHDETALKEILQHEFVHVKQKHTLDILWSEVLCILNWYNPFVWLIRKAIRENLEFIADDKVVQSGVNKQAYQYLLLRVMGNNNFSFTNNFNFSSLKKRIIMMNKIKTAKIHLLKFLFLIPLLGVLLVSFRGTTKTHLNVGNAVVSDAATDEITEFADSVEAKFTGGLEAWKKYLMENLHSDVPAKKGAPQGRYSVTVSFLISKDGSVSEVKAIKDPGFGTGAEAVRVIKESNGKWDPATIAGKPVSYRQKQVITFLIQK
jgi:beta-lactamase regulating signal transducer with metallopeptidase domain